MAEQELRELSVPPDAQEHGGHEVMRAFVVDGSLSIAIQRAFEDPATWGRLLMDVARYVAGLYGRESDISEEEALAEILRQFQHEADNRDSGLMN
jgi:hypothetical protein